MKKNFLLLAIVLLIGTSSFAQPSRHKHHRHNKHHKHMIKHHNGHHDMGKGTKN